MIKQSEFKIDINAVDFEKKIIYVNEETTYSIEEISSCKVASHIMQKEKRKYVPVGSYLPIGSIQLMIFVELKTKDQTTIMIVVRDFPVQPYTEEYDQLLKSCKNLEQKINESMK